MKSEMGKRTNEGKYDVEWHGGEAVVGLCQQVHLVVGDLWWGICGGEV